MSDLPDGAGAPDDDDLDLGALDEGTEPEPIEPGPDDLESNPEPEPEPQSQPTRQERRDERARSRLREVEAERADLARRLAALESRQAQPAAPDPAVSARAEAEFRQSLEQMLPHEAALAVAARSEQRIQQQLVQAELRGFDRADSAEFAALQRTDRAAQRLAPEVERVLAANRAAGDLRLGRLDIFDFLRGRELRTRGPQAARQQRQQGAARVAAQTTRPGSGRGDVARGSGAPANQDSADEALLRGVRAGDV